MTPCQTNEKTLLPLPSEGAEAQQTPKPSKTPAAIMGGSEEDRERFWKNIQIKGPDECWEWKRNTPSKGYGRFTVNRNSFPAHRIAYYYFHNQIDPALLVCHSCDNPPCCNPNHLMLGTSADNMSDAVSRNRLAAQNQTHCVSGHEFTTENTFYNKQGNRRCRTCKAIQQKKNNNERGANRADIRERKRASLDSIMSSASEALAESREFLAQYLKQNQSHSMTHPNLNSAIKTLLALPNPTLTRGRCKLLLAARSATPEERKP